MYRKLYHGSKGQEDSDRFYQSYQPTSLSSFIGKGKTGGKTLYYGPGKDSPNDVVSKNPAKNQNTRRKTGKPMSEKERDKKDKKVEDKPGEKDEKKQDEKKEKEKKHVEDDDEEIVKRFSVKSVNLCIQENAKNHHTHKYKCTKNKAKKQVLVVRRGKPFVIKVTSNVAYDNQRNEMEFIFTTGDDPKPMKSTLLSVPVNEDKNSKSNGKDWFAKIVANDQKNCTIDIEITPFVGCIIGEYRIQLMTSSKMKEDEVHLVYSFERSCYILLNPWCKGDTVYMPPKIPGDDEQCHPTDEYILNPSGGIFTGSAWQPGCRPWDFGQFKEGVLQTSFEVIINAFGGEIDQRMADPILLARKISAALNCQDDNGVLVGNWSGTYDDGVKPTAWTGSAAILLKYAETGQMPVKYGQCWVFSGITTTVCRAIGLPARSVTNFCSSHDTDCTVTIDKFFWQNAKWEWELDKDETCDSIWNFHVWNEVWMKRPDLCEEYDGWQAIDATPQEQSDGTFCCGPAPIKAIYKGDITVPYDAAFIFAEVNADVCHWGVHYGNLPWEREYELLDVKTGSCGKSISTVKPDGKSLASKYDPDSWYDHAYRKDVTDCYKPREGSEEERLAVKRACKDAVKSYGDHFSTAYKDLSIEIDKPKEVLIGDEMDIVARLKNTSKEPKSVPNFTATIVAVTTDGKRGGTILYKSEYDVHVEKEKEFHYLVTFQDCWTDIKELLTMEVTFTAQIGNRTISEDQKIRFRRPDLKLKVLDQVKEDGDFKVKVSMKNPLPIPMENVEILLDGDGLEREQCFKLDSGIPANQDWAMECSLFNNEENPWTLTVSMNNKTLSDITGCIEIVPVK